jgi:hypothetical protein
LVIVERSWLDMKRFMVVQGRPLRARVFCAFICFNVKLLVIKRLVAFQPSCQSPSRRARAQAQ